MTGVGSAFEALGKTKPQVPEPTESTQDTILKALQTALTGERKNPPSWGGAPENLRPWLKQLALWELDNHSARNRWGVKLLQSFPEGSPPRRIADTIETGVLLSEQGYQAILTAILTRYAPYLEAVGPAAIDHFFYGLERSKTDTFAAYITAMETALQEVANQVGERIPDKIAGRILLKHAHLSDVQREHIAIKHNALLTFEQVARALRPLDRPEALLQKVNKTFLVGESMAGDGNRTTAKESEWEAEYEDELISDDDMVLESDGEGGLKELMFDPEREYGEDEMQFVWAYNMAYKDVRKEMQNRRKNRQFFKPKGVKKGFEKGKGKSQSKRSDDKARTKGTPEELLLRTRCWTCDEHRSRDCPKKDKTKTTSSSSFFVNPNSGGSSRAIYVGTSARIQGVITIYAGVQVEGHEAIVDTAAEEAVAGSQAMQNLRSVLASKGLQPRLAEGATAACAGIGGSANISALWDVPISVAGTPGLIRVTEIQDAENFTTPFLLPISYLDLMGADILIRDNVLKLENGKSTPMRKTASGHRAVSITDFDGDWELPDSIFKELGLDGNHNPFRVAEVSPRSKGLRQAPGVAVWLKTKDGKYKLVKQFEGTRNYLIQPNEVFNSQQIEGLTTARTTTMKSEDFPYTVVDKWNISTERLFPDWHGEVFFEELTSPCTQPLSQAIQGDLHSEAVVSHVGEDSETDQSRRPVGSTNSSQVGSTEMCQHVGKVGDSDFHNVRCSTATTGVGTPHSPKSDGRCAGEGGLNPSETKLKDSDQTSQRHWKTFEPINRLQDMVSRAINMCSRRRQIEAEGHQRLFLVDMSRVWESLGKIGMGRRSSRQHGGSNIIEPSPSQLNHPSSYRIEGGLSSFPTSPQVEVGSERAVIDRDGELRNSTNRSGESKCQNEEVSSTSEVQQRQGSINQLNPRERVESQGIQHGTGGTNEFNYEHSLGGADDGVNQLPQQKYGIWSASHEGNVEAKNASFRESSGDLRDQVIGRRGQVQEPRNGNGKPVQFGEPKKPLKVKEGKFHSGTTKSKPSLTALMSVVVISWFGRAEPQSDWLDWLGPWVESEVHHEPSESQYTFPLTCSSKELCRTDFDGQPGLLTKQERSFLTKHLKNFREHAGEVYSPPRVTATAKAQGLKAGLALDLSTGWDFRKKEHRRLALKLINEKRPAVIILSPPCTIFSLLRQLSDPKREASVVEEERQEGLLHLRFAVAIAMNQIKNGRGFVFEHPRYATSWSSKELQKLMDHPDVFAIAVDQCAFGLTVTKGRHRGRLAKKPTLLLTNVPEMAEFVERRCTKDHLHGHLLGGTAQEAARYTPQFTQALVNGIKAAVGLGNTEDKSEGFSRG